MSHPSRFVGPLITTVDEYDGSATVRISATQLGTRYSPHQGRKIVDAWCEFFDAGPTAISSLALMTRTPKRLFACLKGQTQLSALGVKWGDYEDLSPVAGMPQLGQLWLGGASNVQTLRPLAGLSRLRSLVIEDLRQVSDLSPLGALNSVRDLELGGGWMSSRVVRVDSIGFLRQLPSLERLVLHTMAVDDLDYSPLLDLPHLSEIRVARARGMKPSHDDLSAAIPALAPLPK